MMVLHSGLCLLFTTLCGTLIFVTSCDGASLSFKSSSERGSRFGGGALEFNHQRERGLGLGFHTGVTSGGGGGGQGNAEEENNQGRRTSFETKSGQDLSHGLDSDGAEESQRSDSSHSFSMGSQLGSTSASGASHMERDESQDGGQRPSGYGSFKSSSERGSRFGGGALEFNHQRERGLGLGFHTGVTSGGGGGGQGNAEEENNQGRRTSFETKSGQDLSHGLDSDGAEESQRSGSSHSFSMGSQLGSTSASGASHMERDESQDGGQRPSGYGRTALTNEGSQKSKIELGTEHQSGSPEASGGIKHLFFGDRSSHRRTPISSQDAREEEETGIPAEPRESGPLQDHYDGDRHGKTEASFGLSRKSQDNQDQTDSKSNHRFGSHSSWDQSRESQLSGENSQNGKVNRLRELGTSTDGDSDAAERGQSGINLHHARVSHKDSDDSEPTNGAGGFHSSWSHSSRSHSRGQSGTRGDGDALDDKRGPLQIYSSHSRGPQEDGENPEKTHGSGSYSSWDHSSESRLSGPNGSGTKRDGDSEENEREWSSYSDHSKGPHQEQDNSKSKTTHGSGFQSSWSHSSKSQLPDVDGQNTKLSAFQKSEVGSENDSADNEGKRQGQAMFGFKHSARSDNVQDHSDEQSTYDSVANFPSRQLSLSHKLGEHVNEGPAKGDHDSGSYDRKGDDSEDYGIRRQGKAQIDLEPGRRPETAQDFKSKSTHDSGFPRIQPSGPQQSGESGTNEWSNKFNDHQSMGQYNSDTEDDDKHQRGGFGTSFQVGSSREPQNFQNQQHSKITHESDFSFPWDQSSSSQQSGGNDDKVDTSHESRTGHRSDLGGLDGDRQGQFGINMGESSSPFQHRLETAHTSDVRSPWDSPSASHPSDQSRGHHVANSEAGYGASWHSEYQRGGAGTENEQGHISHGTDKGEEGEAQGASSMFPIGNFDMSQLLEQLNMFGAGNSGVEENIRRLLSSPQQAGGAWWSALQGALGLSTQQPNPTDFLKNMSEGARDSWEKLLIQLRQNFGQMGGNMFGSHGQNDEQGESHGQSSSSSYTGRQGGFSSERQREFSFDAGLPPMLRAGIPSFDQGNPFNMGG